MFLFRFRGTFSGTERHRARGNTLCVALRHVQKPKFSNLQGVRGGGYQNQRGLGEWEGQSWVFANKKLQVTTDPNAREGGMACAFARRVPPQRNPGKGKEGGYHPKYGIPQQSNTI